MTHDVFISYSSRDKEVAEAICSGIEREGMRAWMAPRDIVPGASWGESIIEGINASKLMVVVFSSHSNESNQVLREVERAVAKKLPIIPFRIENVLPSRSMEYFLSSSHWLDAHAAPMEAHVGKLINIARRFTRGADLDELADSTDPATAGLKSGIAELAPGSTWDRLTSRRMRRRYLLGAAALGPVAVGIGAWRWLADDGLDPNAIAVLPFRNVANDRSLEHLTMTVPMELNTMLSRTSSVIIRPFDSVKSYRNQNWTPPDVAKTLRVATMVAGSLFRSGQQLRVSVDIIEARRNRQLWGEIFEAVESDHLGLVGRMVPKVADALRLRMETKPGGEMVGTASEEAYELYLRALNLLQDVTDENNRKAISLLEKALAIDPGFARAHALAAGAYVTRFWWNFTDDVKWIDKAEAAGRLAVKLAPGLPETQYALAYALEGKGRRVDAVRGYAASARASLRYMPALESIARYSFYMADFERCLKALDAVSRIDPTKNVHIRKAMCLFFANRRSESRRENLVAERRAQGVDDLTLVAITWVWLEELDAAERVLGLLEKKEPTALSISEIRVWLSAARGRPREARAQMEIIAKRGSDFGMLDEIATFHALLGDRERAVEWLAKAIGMGAPNYARYRSEFFRVARGDPRYEGLLKQLADEYAPLRPELDKLVDEASR